MKIGRNWIDIADVRTTAEVGMLSVPDSGIAKAGILSQDGSCFAVVGIRAVP